MMALSGLMQILAGQHPVSGEKAAGFAKAGLENSKHGAGIPPMEGDPHSFLAWVRKLTGNGMDGMMESGKAIAEDPFNPGSDPSDMEALQAWIGEAMVQLQTAPQAIQPSTLECLDADPPQVDGKMPDPLIVCGGDDCPPVGKRIQQVLSAVQQMMAAGNNGDAGRQGLSTAVAMTNPADNPGHWPDGRFEQEIHSDTQTPVPPHPLDSTVRARPVPGQIEQPVPDSDQRDRPDLSQELKVGRPEGDELKHDANRSAESPVSVSTGQSEKTHETQILSKEAVSDKTKDATMVSAGLTDQQSQTFQDDAPPSRDSGKPISGLRAEALEGQESGVHNHHPVDSVNNSTAEHTRAAVSFPDAARGIPADKPVVAPPAPMARVDESAVKGFQNTVMDQIVERASVRSIQGRSEIHIRLKPEFLGNVQMHVTTEKEQIVVRLMTDQPVVKEIIENNLHHLKTELHNQGLTIDKFDVTVNPNADHQQQRESFAQMFKHPSAPNARKDSRDQDPESGDRQARERAGQGQSDGERVNYFA